LAIECTTNHEFLIEKLSLNEIKAEKIMMGLRTKYGVNLSDISISQKKIEMLLKNRYIILKNGTMAVTYEGLKKLNLVVKYILDGLVV
jgi:coproporphyrinogen III oxidase-like Fe-S oxidoreductase